MEKVKEVLNKTVVGTLTVSKLLIGVAIGLIGFIIIKKKSKTLKTK